MIFPGIDSFRLGQKEIIDHVLSGHDVVAVLPTGGGKSLCYQQPAYAKQGLVIVISPLIALMRDQVEALKAKGLRAGALHSGQSLDEKREIFREIEKPGEFILYLSPERVQKEGFQKWIKSRKVQLFAIDEAHCISQWGHDFRSEYSLLAELKKWRPDVPILALTASATPLVLDDISRQLGIRKAKRIVHGFYRPNLFYQVENCVDESEKFEFVVGALRQFSEGRRLIYCGTRKSAEELSAALAEKFHGIAYYHAGLTSQDRTRIQNAYMQGEISTLVATNAFGMGIDQPDVRLVVHFQMPANIDSLYQEMGRAGRDGADSTCLMLYSKKDKGLQAYFIESSQANADIKSLRWRNLEALVDYSEGGECRHKEILTYFRDSQRISNCGHCDICRADSVRKVLAFPDLVASSRQQVKSRSKKKSFELGREALSLDQLQLVDRLKEWRKREAAERDIPAFLVFGDKTLRAIARTAPTTTDQLLKIHGIGEQKKNEFGESLLEFLRRQ